MALMSKEQGHCDPNEERQANDNPISSRFTK